MTRLSEEQYQALIRHRRRAVPDRNSAAPVLPQTPQRRTKYGNKPTVVCGEQFDSGKEAARYEQLLLLERAGQISQLRHHVTYPLRVGDIDICQYEVDFQYTDNLGTRHWEDVKVAATITQLFRVKARLMLALHGIVVEVVQ